MQERLCSIFLIFTVVLLSDLFFSPRAMAADMAELRAAACAPDSGTVPSGTRSPWHISNLYNCKNDTFFVPYQLWSGAKWNGDKNAACMHRVDREWDLTDHRTIPLRNGDTRDIVRPSRTFIKGPVSWTNPVTGEALDVLERHKTDRRKLQRFTCHAKGLGRVTDYRKTRSWRTPQPVGRCKFPAGYGWNLGKRRSCIATAIEITKVELEDNNTLRAITFKWWVKRGRSTELHFDHIYRYERELGASDAWAQDVVEHGKSNYRPPEGRRRRRDE